MLLAKAVFLISLPFCFSKAVDVTFKNATFRGYSIYTEKFKKTIISSNSLKDFLPKSTFDKIEFVEQNIPILRENSLADLGDLDELVIEFCQVYEIQPGALKNVPQLRRLSLKGNKLEEIKEGVFNNLDLSTIDLSLNSITVVQSGAFNNLPSLLNLNLNDNNIDKWNPRWFKNTPMLTRVSMANNSIEKLPTKAFENLQGARQFGKLKLRMNIVLSYNKIKEIDPKAFEGLTEMNNLWLDHNELETFDENLLNNVDVKDLRINKNNIKCLNGDLSKMIKGEATHLDSNPFDCECLGKIKTWADKNGKYIDIFFADMDCTAQRIKTKMIALQNRLNEIREKNEEFQQTLPSEKTPIK